MKKEDVLRCSFVSWYNLFKAHTIRSTVINLPDEIIDFIENAPLILPQNSTPIEVNRREYSDSDEEPWSDENDDENISRPHFPKFEKRVNEAIEDLGGFVFPKLNWSAPKDAAWINFANSLKCNSAADILLLLKASDFISHDLYTPFSLCSDYTKCENAPHRLNLVLREWRNFRPECEFRCFISSKKIIAICQRNIDSYSVFIETEQANIINNISNFFGDVVKHTFSLADYVMDVYVSQKLDSSKCVKLIDFNVFGPPTDGLLFSWDELQTTPHNREIEFRRQENKTLQSAALTQYKIPIDFVDISAGNDPEKLIDLVQAHVEEQDEINALKQL